MADRASGDPAGPGTISELGSITKQFTAAAILRLVEQGNYCACWSSSYAPRTTR